MRPSCKFGEIRISGL